jgi:thiol-disulfide isomerase/thioredoxin
MKGLKRFAFPLGLGLFAFGLIFVSSWFLFNSSLRYYTELHGTEIPKNIKLLHQKEEKVLSSFIGAEKTLIIFWATWCDPCVKEIQSMPKLLPEIKKRGYELLFVNYDDLNNKAMAEDFANKYGVESTYDFKGEFLYSMGVATLPFSLIVNKEGIITKAIASKFTLKDLEEKSIQ